MDLSIDSNVPVPDRYYRRIKGYTAILRKLEVGQSVLLPTSPASACKLARGALGAGRYTSREEEEGTRIWRVS